MDSVIVLTATNDQKVEDSIRSVAGDTYSIFSARSLTKLLDLLQDLPADIALVDEVLDDRPVLEFLPEIIGIRGGIVILVMAADPRSDPVRQTLSRGAYDIISKPIKKADLLYALQKAGEDAKLSHKVRFLEEKKAPSPPPPWTAGPEPPRPRISPAVAPAAPLFGPLRRFVDATVNIRDMEKLFDYLIQALTEFFTVSKAALVLYDEKAGELSVKASRGLDEELLELLHFEVYWGIYAWLRENDRILLVDEEKKRIDERKLDAIYKETTFLQAKLCVPLAVKKKPLGFFSLGNKFSGEPYTKEELDIIFALAGSASSAIENALLFEKNKESAIRDELTQLYNRHYWERSLEDEINRSKRYKRPLSVAIFDIDYFKKINDTFGHPFGDEVLKGLARFLMKSSRNIDVVGRYGGEEFITILPETTAELAYNYCERLRQDVQDRLGNEVSEEFVHRGLTISGGMTDCDQKNDTALEIIDRADKALYKAKREGRNRIREILHGDSP